MTTRVAKAQALQMRRTRVMEYRRDGWTEHQIARVLGLTRETVWRDLKICLGELAKHRMGAAAEIRELLDAKLDEQLRTWSPLARARRVTVEEHDSQGKIVEVERTIPADGEAADRVLRILHQKARLHGAEAPQRIEVDVPRPIRVQVNFGHGPLPIIDTAIQGEAEDVTDAA